MPHQMRHNRHKRPIIRRRGRQLQASTGVGHRDVVVQSKKWMFFDSIPYTNATAGYAFGLSNVNIATANSGIANSVYERLMAQAALSYEEYRVRRVSVRAQPGRGFTNDDRIKASIFARVDVNSQPSAATVDNLNSVVCAESTVNKTFTERSNVHLVDFRPICYSTGGSLASSRPILPSNIQWYNIEERSTHLWRGATVCPLIPEPVPANSLSITTWVEVEIEFRSRRPDFSEFTASSVISPTPRGGSFEDQQDQNAKFSNSSSQTNNLPTSEENAPTNAEKEEDDLHYDQDQSLDDHQRVIVTEGPTGLRRD